MESESHLPLQLSDENCQLVTGSKVLALFWDLSSET